MLVQQNGTSQPRYALFNASLPTSFSATWHPSRVGAMIDSYRSSPVSGILFTISQLRLEMERHPDKLLDFLNRQSPIPNATLRAVGHECPFQMPKLQPLF